MTKPDAFSIDSGSPFIFGPPDAVKAFYKAISSTGSFTNAGITIYRYPCKPAPDVAFNWGGKNWKLSEAKSVRCLFDKSYFADPFLICSFNLGETTKNSGQCVGSIQGLEGLGSNVWILGDSFMKNVYTAFDFDHNQVGFATLA